MSKEFKYDSDTEVGKYKKNTESNISKANKKSKHKHQYEECLIQYKLKFSDRVHTGLSSYCTVCGKIGGKFDDDKSIVADYRIKIGSPIGLCWKLMSDEELYKKYHNRMPVFFIEDLFSNYVNLNELNGE